MINGRLFLFFVIWAFIFPTTTLAANTPCSGKKGGIDHCEGRFFICKDGTVSQSKKNCSTEFGGSGSDSKLPRKRRR